MGFLWPWSCCCLAGYMSHRPMSMNDERWDAVGPSMDHTQEHTARSLWYEVPCRRRGSTTVRLCRFQRGITPLDSNIVGTLFNHLRGKAEKGGKELLARFAGHSFATMGSIVVWASSGSALSPHSAMHAYWAARRGADGGSEQSHWQKLSFHHALGGKTFSALQRWRLRKDVHEPAGRAVSARW